jgi:hypothetical protein
MSHSHHPPEPPDSLEEELRKLDQACFSAFGPPSDQAALQALTEPEAFALVQQAYDQIPPELQQLSLEQAVRLDQQYLLRELTTHIEQALLLVRSLQTPEPPVPASLPIDPGSLAHLKTLTQDISNLLDQLEQIGA